MPLARSRWQRHLEIKSEHKCSGAVQGTDCVPEGAFSPQITDAVWEELSGKCGKCDGPTAPD